MLVLNIDVVAIKKYFKNAAHYVCSVVNPICKQALSDNNNIFIK